MADLEERVAALEAAMSPGLRPFDMPPLTAEQEAQLKRDFDETMRGPITNRILPSVPPLTPEQIRQLLRECVTVVKPGETLVVRVPLTWTPDEVFRYQRNVNDCHDEGYIPFKVLIIGGDELAIAEPSRSREGRLVQQPDGDPSELVVAYCAPGLKGYAERLLESNGERVREVIEHPYMAGHTDVILAVGPPFCGPAKSRP